VQITSLKESIQNIIQQVLDVVTEVEDDRTRLQDIQKQLFGLEYASDISESAELGALRLNIDSDSPSSLPQAEEGSVLGVLKLVWEQLLAIQEACVADSADHTRRGGPRLDIQAVNYALDLVMQGTQESDPIPGCPFCNMTQCRILSSVCLLDSSRTPKQLPSQLVPDVTLCWASIDKYCSSEPGTRDPGCGCQASERCWSDGVGVGWCPKLGENGERECPKLQEMDCQDYYAEDLPTIYNPPTFSPADEVMIEKLQELRDRLLVESRDPAVPESFNQVPASSCEQDRIVLLRNFEKIQQIASRLWVRRQEASKDLEHSAGSIQTKQNMQEEGETTLAQLMTRVALETQSMIAQRKTVEKQLQALNTVATLLQSYSPPKPQELGSRPASSRDGSAVSCQQLKRDHPTSPSGLYWVTLGRNVSDAIRVYCDMTTDGGGWTLFWKNVGGAVSPQAKLSHASNAHLLAASNPSRVDLVTPVYVDRFAQINHPVYQYYANRKNQEFLKFMTLYRGLSDAFSSQRIRLEMGPAKLAEVFEAPIGCSVISSQPIRMFSSVENNPDGLTDYYMGETRTIINRRGESFGLSNSGSQDDMCDITASTGDLSGRCSAILGTRSESAPSSHEPVVCDFEMLRRLGDTGNLTVVGTWEYARHVFSYVHHSPSAREANRCMYRCWDATDENGMYNDVFVWAARGKCPESAVGVCSQHGTCSEGVCECEAGYQGEACETKVSCGSAGDALPHLTVECSGEEYLDTCDMACDIGYVLRGDKSIECDAVGNWSSILPICVARNCSEFPAQDVLGAHGAFSCTGTSYNNTCDMWCDKGYRLTARGNRVTCSATGTWIWNGESSRCIDEESEAIIGSFRIPDGNYTDTYLTENHDSLVYAILSSSGLPVSMFPNVQIVAVYPGSVIVSYRITVDEKMGDGVRKSLEANVENGDLAKNLREQGLVAGSVEVKEKFEVIYRGGRCIEPPTPGNASKICDGSPDIPGTSCEFTCASGFSIEGDTRRVCQETGLYSGSQPDCSPMSCEPPSQPTNKNVKMTCDTNKVTGYAEGAKCVFTCPNNFRINGSTQTTCYHKAWMYNNDTDTTCTVIDKCVNVVCPASLPICELGSYVGDESTWTNCCFNKDMDCIVFETFVTVTISMPAEVSTTSSTGETNLYIVRNAIAISLQTTVANVVYLLGSSSETESVFTLAVQPSSKYNSSDLEPALMQQLTKNKTGLLNYMVSKGLNINTYTVMVAPSSVPREPTDLPKLVEFFDEDGRPDWLAGKLVIHKSSATSRATTKFVVYFGDGSGDTKFNRIGDSVASVDVQPEKNNPYVWTIIPRTQIPTGVHEWLVFPAGPFAESSTAFRLPFTLTVRQGVDLVNGSVVFHDEDPRRGWIRGHATLALPEDSGIDASNVTAIVLYFGDGGNLQINKIGHQIGEAPFMNGGNTTIIEVPTSLAVPEGATHYVVFCRSVDVEGSQGLTDLFNNEAELATGLVAKS